MVFELVRFAVVLAAVGYCGYKDLKTSDVPAEPIIVGAILGLVLYGADGFSSIQPALINLLIFSGIGALFYFTGSWGAGDSAVLVLSSFLFPKDPLLTIFTVFSIGLAYSTLYILFYSWKNKKLGKIKGACKGFPMLSIPIAPAAAITVFFLSPAPLFFSAILSAAVFFVLLTPILYVVFKESEKLFKKKISTAKLREGDMLAEPVSGISNRLIRGLTGKEVNRIRKMKKFVLVRDGVRYTPVFFLALLALFLLG